MPTDPAEQTAELLMDVDALRILWKACGVPKLEKGIVRMPLEITTPASSKNPDADECVAPSQEAGGPIGQ